jgi:hypothetical protein
VDEGLDDGVVGGVHVRVQGEGALAVAVEGGVPVRGDDPVLPTQVPVNNKIIRCLVLPAQVPVNKYGLASGDTMVFSPASPSPCK